MANTGDNNRLHKYPLVLPTVGLSRTHIAPIMIIRPEQLALDQGLPLGASRTGSVFKGTWDYPSSDSSIEQRVVAVKVLGKDVSPNVGPFSFFLMRYSHCSDVMHRLLRTMVFYCRAWSTPTFCNSLEYHLQTPIRSS